MLVWFRLLRGTRGDQAPESIRTVKAHTNRNLRSVYRLEKAHMRMQLKESAFFRNPAWEKIISSAEKELMIPLKCDTNISTKVVSCSKKSYPSLKKPTTRS